MTTSRRDFLALSAGAAAGLVAARRAGAQPAPAAALDPQPTQGVQDMPDMPGMQPAREGAAGAPGSSGAPPMQGMPGMQHDMQGMPDMPGMQHDMQGMPDMPGMPGMNGSQHTAPATATPAPARPPAAASATGNPAAAHDRLGYLPVEAPDLMKLPWTMEGGVKVFRLRAEVVRTRFVPWREAETWGYNGSTPGPTIEAREGDRVRIVVENHLPEATNMHWHGLEVPIEMDGVEGIVQDFIPPGGTFDYEFTLHQNGTFFYHSHRPMQQMMGMIGLFIVHPRVAHEPRVERDFAWILQEFAALPGNPTPNSMAMEFNWLTMNGKSAPATTPAICRQGERVRIRLVNLGMDHHPMHLHGATWVVTGTEGGRIPQAQWRPGNTELVGVAQARDMEFVARNPGDWMLHCHLPHHMMNGMVSMVGPMSQPPAAGAASSTGVRLAAADARQVPGYPQDMFMVVDDQFKDRPETWGLRHTWSGGLMGMMTLIRVLKPDAFETVQRLRRRAAAAPPASTPATAAAAAGQGGRR